MMSLRGTKQRRNLFLRNGLLPASQARYRNDKQLSLRTTKSRSNLLLRIILTISLLVSAPAQASIEFDGVNDYIDLSSGGLALSTLSVSVWIKLNITQNTRIFVANYANVKGFGLGINDLTNNQIKWFTSTDGGSSNTLNSSTILTNNTWYHIVGTFDGTTKRIYVNGVNESNISWINPIGYTGALSSIGALKDTNRQNLNGSIDDVRIYNRALTLPEVEALYKSKRKRIGGSLANGLVAHYEMDGEEIGSTVSTVIDVSGNSNHGTGVGGASLKFTEGILRR